MSIRRTLSLMLAFSLAHLAFAGTDFACVAHPEQADAMAGMDHGLADHPAPDKDACDTPAAVDCCDMVSSCMVTMGVTCKKIA